MPSDLTPTQREDREAERLINKKPAPSRKRTQRRGPKHDNRRKRMDVDDPDVSGGDKDMSLNYKSAAARLLTIAELVAGKKRKKLKYRVQDEAVKEAEKAKADEKAAEKAEALGEEPKPASSADAAGKAVDRLQSALHEASPDLADRFKDFAAKNLRGGDPMAARAYCDQNLKAVHELSKQKLSGSPKKIAQSVAAMWSSDPASKTYFGRRAGTILALERAMTALDIPSSFVVLSKHRPGDDGYNRDLLQEVIEDFGRQLTDADLKNEAFVQYLALASAYEHLRTNPKDADAASISKAIASGTQQIMARALDAISIGALLGEWEKAAREGNFSKVVQSRDADPGHDTYSFFDDIQRDSEQFFKGDRDRAFDPADSAAAMAAAIKRKFGAVPKRFLDLVEDLQSSRAKVAASYDGATGKAMPSKTAAYHGTIGQGHPDPDGFGRQSPEKRHLGKEHFDAIVSSAKDMLKEDWLAYGWDGGLADAQPRAALDLAIQVTDGGDYQSKVDAETYNMLLARLVDDGADQFSETVRSASMQNEHAHSIMRIASELRLVDPRAALDVMKCLRDIASGGRTASDLTDKDAEALSEDKMEDIKEVSKQLSDAKSGEDLASGLKSMADTIGKTASGARFAARIASADLEKLEDMTEEEVAKFVDGLKSAKSGDELADMLEKALAEFDKAHVASVRMPIATLVRLAHENPAVRPALMPFLVAAKKKSDKKKGKTSQKKDEKPAKKDDDKKAPPFAKKDEKSDKKDGKKAPPFGGKKAPPFGGKKKPPFGKKKASVHIASDDAEW